MIITETQRKEIKQINSEHREALLAYGAYMYKHGIIKGAVCLAIGVGCVFIIEETRKIYEHQKSKKKKENEV